MTTTEITMDGVRGYLRELRIRQHISQRKLAENIGLSERTVISWETGETVELKGGPLVRAVVYLHGSWAHIQQLIAKNANEEEGRRLAEERLSLQQQAVIDPFLETDEGTRALLQSVYEISKNPLLKERIKAYLDGLTDQLDLSGVPREPLHRRWFRRKRDPR